ncbi:MAG TPA: VanW family protein [Herpetosiphonaceae bacterium]
METHSINPITSSGVVTVEQLLTAGYTALAVGDYARAERLFRRAVQVNARSAEAWRALADTQTGARHGMCLRWVEYVEGTRRQAQPTPQPVPPALPTVVPRQGRYQARLVGVVGATTLALLLLGSDIAYRERVLPGVHIGPISVGNLQPAAVERAIRQHQQRTAEQLVEVRAGGRSWHIPMRALLRDRSAELARAAIAYGHDPAFWTRATTRARAFLGQEYIVSAPPLDEDAIEAFVAVIADQITRERRDAQVLRTEQGWIVVPEQVGQSIDQIQLAAQVADLLKASAWQAQATPQPLIAAMVYQPPTRTAAQLEPLRQRLQDLAAQPLEIQLGEQRWTMDRSMLMDRTTVIDPAALKPDPALITQQLEPIASQIAVAPQASYLERQAERVRTIVPGNVGRELDREAAIQTIIAALEAHAPQVRLPVREIQPPPGEAEQLGLLAELGRGESQFVTYSSPERDANVAAGGNDIDGVLIAPGEVFSFTQTVGAITWEKGYRWGEMIEAGVMVPSLGGGICQVSTTVFRAAFWSGLEIVERHHHTWRLPWYEVDAPPGMDATIALGGPDLKIRNNTQHHILLKVETDLVTKRQTVVIYGTPDGRKVEMQLLDNGNIGVHRHVINGSQTVGEDTFVSYYSR